jgi:type I restriction-modification system, M subunit
MTEQMKDVSSDAEKLSGGGTEKIGSATKIVHSGAAAVSANEHAELHRIIWRIANDLRGSVDGWDFKQYVLGMMFYRFISENLSEYNNKYEHDAGDLDFDYAKLHNSDIDQDLAHDIIEERGFFLFPSQLFENVYAQARTDENLNETFEKVFQAVETSTKNTQSERNFAGLFDDFDVNSKKLGSSVQDRNKTLYKLMSAVAEMKLETSYQQSTNDTFGDAYEYLMGMYAANAGKSGGEYYTPQEVSELLARIATDGKKSVGRVYEPKTSDLIRPALAA